MKKEITEITIPKPFNAHVHLREDPLSSLLIPITEKYFCGATAMGNFPVPITTAFQAGENMRRYFAYTSENFTLFISLMLTRDTTIKTLKGVSESLSNMVKYIPDSASTNSNNGIPFPELVAQCYDQLQFMEDNQIRLHIHLELKIDPTTGKEIRYLAREEAAIPYAIQLMKSFPRLKSRLSISALKNFPTPNLAVFQN